MAQEESGVRIDQLQMLIYKFVKKGRPFMVKGAPGIGKSDSVRYVAKKIAQEEGLEYNEGTSDPSKYSLIDVRISQLDPSDLRGVPFPVGNRTEWLVPKWLPNDGKGILFFDEINLAPSSVQAACYQLILDRRLGDYVLPAGWTIVAAGNRAIDKANVFPMAAPLKNRFSHATLRIPSHEEWTKWAFEHSIKSDVIAFITFKPSLLFKFDSKSNEDAFPTPRSWANASYMTDDIETTGITGDRFDRAVDETLLIVASCVGYGAAYEYEGFLKLKKSINLDEIIKNPKKVREITRIDLKYSMMSGLAEKYRNDAKNVNTDNILKVIAEMDRECGVFLLRLMKAAKFNSFVNDVTKQPSWMKIYEGYGKYIF